MKLAYAAIAATSLAALAQPALAQPAMAQQAEAPAMAQQAEAPAATQMAPVSDAELQNFVIAASMIGEIQRDEEIDQAEKQKASMEVLSQAQMSPQRFNTIGAALQTDEKLQARVTQTVERLREQQAQG